MLAQAAELRRPSRSLRSSRGGTSPCEWQLAAGPAERQACALGGRLVLCADREALRARTNQIISVGSSLDEEAQRQAGRLLERILMRIGPGEQHAATEATAEFIMTNPALGQGYVEQRAANLPEPLRAPLIVRLENQIQSGDTAVASVLLTLDLGGGEERLRQAATALVEAGNQAAVGDLLDRFATILEPGREAIAEPALARVERSATLGRAAEPDDLALLGRMADALSDEQRQRLRAPLTLARTGGQSVPGCGDLLDAMRVDSSAVDLARELMGQPRCSG